MYYKVHTLQDTHHTPTAKLFNNSSHFDVWYAPQSWQSEVINQNNRATNFNHEMKFEDGVMISFTDRYGAEYLLAR